MSEAEFIIRITEAGNSHEWHRVFHECWPQVRGTLPELMAALGAADARLEWLLEQGACVGAPGQGVADLQAA